MKIVNVLVLCLIVLFTLPAQQIPIDFEADGNGAGWVWTTFENDTNPSLEIVANPDPTGINTSATVAKFTALQSGQPFAGCETLHGAGIGTFTINEQNAIIRIKVWKPVVSDVGIKLVRSDNWSLGEIKIANTKVNEWEQIEFDFSAHMGNTYDQIVIFPDFNGRSSDHVIYFDEVYGESSISGVQHFSEAGIHLFPNPTTDRLVIDADLTFSRYEIYTITGELVAEKRVNNENIVDVSTLSAGLYLIKAFVGQQPYVEKFVKR